VCLCVCFLLHGSEGKAKTEQRSLHRARVLSPVVPAANCDRTYIEREREKGVSNNRKRQQQRARDDATAGQDATGGGVQISGQFRAHVGARVR